MTPSRDGQNHYKDGEEERDSYHADGGDDLIIMIWSLTIGKSHDHHEYNDRSHHINEDRSQTSTALKQAQLALGCQGRSDCNSSCFRINIVVGVSSIWCFIKCLKVEVARCAVAHAHITATSFNDSCILRNSISSGVSWIYQ